MSEFTDFLSEVFENFGPVSCRKMFGGYGLYHNGLMIGLVAEDTLYLKADEKSRSCFLEKKLPQFEYDKKGKPVKMSYFLAPDEIFDDPDAAVLWAQRAYGAASRAKR